MSEPELSNNSFSNGSLHDQYNIVEGRPQSEEELPSLSVSNSPEVLLGESGSSVRMEDDDSPSSVEELLSLATSENPQQSPPESPEELVSLSGSPQEPTINVDSFSDLQSDGRPSTSSGIAQRTSIRSFKTSIDENGETIFELASDEGEYDQESEEEVELISTSSPPSVGSVGPVATSNNWQNQRMPVRGGQYAQYEGMYRLNDPADGQNSDESSEDPDYSPGSETEIGAGSTSLPGTVAQRVAGRRSRGSGHPLGSGSVLTHLGTIRQVQVGTTSVRRRARTTPRPRRRKAKLTKKVRPTVPKIQRPLKALVPKTIFQDENGNENAKLYRSQMTRLNSRRTDVAFNVSSEEEDVNSYYKIGEVFLRMGNSEDLKITNREMLFDEYPGLKQITIHSSDYRDVALLELKTEKTLPEDEAARRPKPKLSQQDMRRNLIVVIRKMYLFPCHIEGFDTKLFTSKGFGNKKVFRMDFVGFSEDHGRIHLDILLNKTFIMGPHNLSDIPYSQPKILPDIFNSLFNVQLPPEPVYDGTSQKEDVPWFYGQIKKYHANEVLPAPTFSLQPEIVGPTLRDYQRGAVQWMLYREGVLSTPAGGKVNLTASFIEKMYIPVSIGGHSIYYNPHIGYICWSVPDIGKLPSGGILADEMGLGKTVEVICLVLLNPRPKEEFKSKDSVLVSNSDDEMDSDSEPSLNESDFDTSISSGSDESEEDSDECRKTRRKSQQTKTAKLSSRNRKKNPTKYSNASHQGRQTQSQLKLRRKRNISPCTFETLEGPGASGSDNKNPLAEDNSIDSATNEVILLSPPASAQQIATCSNKRSNNNSIDFQTGVPKKMLKMTEPTTTYQRLKAVYDTALLGYCEARNSPRAKFNGTFFDTKIARIARFECICGGSNDNNKNKVMQCAVCRSSQHADCVGLDRDLLHSFKGDIQYVCPHCTTLEQPYPAKSTLIVTPNTISHQWINELKRHVKKQNMTIMFYKGVSNHGYIPPIKLAEFDIIITTYNTLTNELNYVDLPHTNSEDGRRFRNPKRFMTTPSPLPYVQWWRICLDEAQMVEGISTKMSMMTRKLHAVNKWCITGTPINEGLQDLFGLFAFLSIEPVALDFWWNKLVQEPFHRQDVSLLYELFGQLIWRMGKMDVLDQLGIPPQTSLVRWLTFSEVEEHFYKQQYEICSKKILDKISRLRQTNHNILESRLSTLDRQILQSLLLPFLELRKACCHPQMVKGQSLSLQKGTMTMEELLAQLIKKTSIQCADDHRQIVASLNGMAGIHMINEEWLAASERYREVLQSAEKNKEHFSTDSLQLLHTMENLADLLDRHHDGVPYTLRDGSLRTEAEALKQKYLEKYASGVKSAQLVVEPLAKLTEELSTEFKCHNASWWSITLSKAAQLGKIDDFVKRIKDELSVGPDTKQMKNFLSLANKFNDANSLEHVLIGKILEIENLRKSVSEGLHELQQSDPSAFVPAAINCHLRKKAQLHYKESDELGFRCQLCQYHDHFLRYESALFKETKKKKIVRTGRQWQQQKIMGDIASDLTEDERNLVLLKEEEELFESLEHVNVGLSNDQRRGTWGDSETENVLKLIRNFARINRLPKDVRDDGTTHIKLFEAMKKEFRFMRLWWMQIYDQVSSHDELNQATTRLCLSNGVDISSLDQGPSTSSGSSRRKKKPKELQSTQIEQDQRIQNINVLERHEIETKIAQMQIELSTGKENLSVHMGQLLYLETLKKKDYGKQGTVNSEDCPVCQCQLGCAWTVLRCGHSFCSECLTKMCPNVLQSFLCPLCRNSVKYSEVSFVDTKTEVSSPSKSAKKTKDIKGSHSTKVEAIIETLLQLQESHPGEKVIIFSSWVDVLEIVSQSLQQNDISNILLNQLGKKFQTELERFKKTEDIQVLLMPLASGSKGLNIIEATHILLVEPILSLASEFQAIGRIHRIGQTKPTFVHRFYIKNTIEEQLFEVLKAHDVSSDSEGQLTVADLQNLIRDGKNYSGPNIVTLD